MTFAELVARARALGGGTGGRAILGLTGAPAAGKTTLAEELTAALGDGVAHVPMDGFHLADAELDRLGRRARKGAPDTFDVLGYAAMLRRLHEDTDDVVYAPAFERTIEQPIAGAIAVPRSARLIITEGNYLLLESGGWEWIRPLLDEVWYADLDPATRLGRLVDRHVRFGKDRSAAVAWATGTDERNAELIAATRDRADLIVPANVIHGIGSTLPR